MAYYFFMVIECGRIDKDAEAVAGHFDNMPLKLADGLETFCSAGTYQDIENNYWCTVFPTGVNYASPDGSDHKMTDEPHVTEIALLLYQKLRTASPFRYALAGWEPQDFALFSELDQDVLQMNGIVISQDVFDGLDGTAKDLECFGADYLWKPYRGEKIFGK